MNRTEYLSELKRMLSGLPEDEKQEILYDYEEHFRAGTENGKTEEEIALALGDVRVVARQFRADFAVRQAETNASAGNIFKAVLAAVGMGFFNLVFVLGPFFGVVGLLIGLFAAAGGTIIGGIGMILAIILSPFFPSYIIVDVNGVFTFFSGLGIAAFGLLFLIGDCYLAKFFYKVTVRYLKWNIEIIKK